MSKGREKCKNGKILSGFFIDFFSKFWLFNQKRKTGNRCGIVMGCHLDDFSEIRKNDQQSEIENNFDNLTTFFKR